MLNLLEKHKDIIKNFRVDCYDQEGDSYRIKIEISFLNDSRLFPKEYLFSNGERKYAFDWVDVRLFFPQTHPREMAASKETTPEEILTIIAKELEP